MRRLCSFEASARCLICTKEGPIGALYINLNSSKEGEP